MRIGALPEYPRVLSPRRGYFHDSWEPVHAWLRVLRGARGVAVQERILARRVGAGACGGDGGLDGVAVCGADERQSGRTARWWFDALGANGAGCAEGAAGRED